MSDLRYSVNQHPVQTLLTWIKSGDIAIPEIQRPFVWKATKVRDFIDSLYRGYPVGYLIACQNPNIRLKDGTQLNGKRILIDGQQRVKALLAALLGQQIVDKGYKKRNITIAFHPGEEKFEVSNPAIGKDSGWIADIAEVFAPDTQTYQLVDKYCEANPNVDKGDIFKSMGRLENIRNNSLGLIELNPDLDVETVSEIFIRINSQGVPLNAADFAMSKMAANETYEGHQMRKCIDYFCHLAVAPEAYNDLAKDDEFKNTDYFRAMAWLKREKDDLYDPSYTDMLRVAFTSEFKRGKLDDLVALLSGRDFEKRTFEETIVEKSFAKLKESILRYMNETNFKHFVMILRSVGFVDVSMIQSKNAVNFAYILYLTLRSQRADLARVERLVGRWFVMSILTDRYTGSSESAFALDIRKIEEQEEQKAYSYLDEIEQAELSDTFWNLGLPQQMSASGANNRYFNIFLASQVKANDKGFLSCNLCVRDLLEGQSQKHHIFPRSYLKKHGFLHSRYNQIANYAVMQGEINRQIGGKAPKDYFGELWEKCNNGKRSYGNITDSEELRANLAAHCIPEGMDKMNFEDYDKFLEGRRRLMALKIRDYYRRL